MGYFTMLVFGGLPLFYMELCLGQFHRCGCLSLWKKICPVLKGVGYAICVIDIYMGMFYNTIIGWAVYYFVASIIATGEYAVNSTVSLPWTSCGNAWNNNLTCTIPSEEYFQREVLEVHKGQGIADPEIQPQNAKIS